MAYTIDTENGREVNEMVSIILDYAVVSPAVVEICLNALGFDVFCSWDDVDEDCYIFNIGAGFSGDSDVESAMMAVMERFVWGN